MLLIFGPIMQIFNGWSWWAADGPPVPAAELARVRASLRDCIAVVHKDMRRAGTQPKWWHSLAFATWGFGGTVATPELPTALPGSQAAAQHFGSVQPRPICFTSRLDLCSSRALNATGQPRVTLSRRGERS